MLQTYDIRNARARPITNSVIDVMSPYPHAADMLGKSDFLALVEQRAPSRADIARAIGVAPPRITEMYKGERDLTYDEAKALADRYQISEGPYPVRPNAELLARLLLALVPLVPSSGLTEQSAGALSRALLRGIELLEDGDASQVSEREVGMAARAAMLLFRDSAQP